VGGPGTGKTMLGLEFLVRGAEAGHPGVLLTFEEKDVALRRYAQVFGWDLAALEAQGQLTLISGRFHPDAVLSGDFDLRGTLALLSAKAESMKASRIFIDAPDVILGLLESMAKERAQFHAMNAWAQDQGMTVIMTVKGNASSPTGSHYDFLEYMADCVLYLDQRVYDQITTRRLRVVKYRGSAFSRNEYPFSITGKGVWIIPVTQTSLQHQALGACLSSGVAGLDALLDGGYRRSSCVLISGYSGTGKTTFACSFVASIIAQGERLLYLNFEESWDALVSCMISPGIDLQQSLASGNLRFVSTMPESQGIEEHLIQAFQEIEAFQPRHLVLDAISACRRMGSAHAAFDYLLRLMDHCKERGVTAVLTNLTASPEPVNEITGIDLSSVIDTVILLRNIEREGCFVRELAVLKSRGRAHSRLIHEFQITNRGVVITAKEGSHDR
jgi:circadian clock protein KaiC